MKAIIEVNFLKAIIMDNVFANKVIMMINKIVYAKNAIIVG